MFCRTVYDWNIALPPFWLDFEMLSMCLLFCLLYFECCVVLCLKKKKKKMLITKKKYLCFIILRGDLNICGWETDEKLRSLCCSAMDVLPSKSLSRSRDWKLWIGTIFLILMNTAKHKLTELFLKIELRCSVLQLGCEFWMFCLHE